MPLLDWLNKPASLQTARHVPYRLLECVPALGYGATPNANLLIQGDNLEALKALYVKNTKPFCPLVKNSRLKLPSFEMNTFTLSPYFCFW